MRISSMCELYEMDDFLPTSNTSEKLECDLYEVSYPQGWEEKDHDEFLREFFTSLSEGTDFESCCGIGKYLTLTPKLAAAMREKGYNLKKEEG